MQSGNLTILLKTKLQIVGLCINKQTKKQKASFQDEPSAVLNNQNKMRVFLSEIRADFSSDYELFFAGNVITFCFPLVCETFYKTKGILIECFVCSETIEHFPLKVNP